jgi:hypothetical protein
MINESINESWRNNVIELALIYAEHNWKPMIENSYHGYDEDGILVNTPDESFKSSKYSCGWWLSDHVNKAIPYNWGGCSTIVEFDAGIAAGKYAGNVPDTRDNGISKNCVGVDCSGLVTICWGLTIKQSTRSLTNITSPLDSIDLLLPGDLLLLPGSHVMIFKEFLDNLKTKAQIIDATRATGKVSLRIVDISKLIDNGYQGYRKLNHND